MSTATVRSGERSRKDLCVRMELPWEQWLDRLCLVTRRHRSNLVEEALAAYSERMGYEAPPPRV